MPNLYPTRVDRLETLYDRDQPRCDVVCLVEVLTDPETGSEETVAVGQPWEE